MRHDPNRHFLYPVARQFSDDYPPESRIITDLKAVHTADSVHVTLTYKIDDASIIKQVRSSNARCVAMLYCMDTLYRQSIQADINNPLQIKTSVPLNLLRNRVQVHPVVVAQKEIQQLPLDTVHKEYKGLSFSITMGQPLAVDTPWFFDVNPPQKKRQSIFNLIANTEDKYKPDEFEVRIDPKKRYIEIIAGDDTMAWFHQLRSDRNITLPSVYMSSLIAVLAQFKDYDEEYEGNVPDTIPSDGWFWSLRKRMDELGITVSNDSDKEQLSLIMAAQRLLTGHGDLRPFRRLLWLKESG